MDCNDDGVTYVEARVDCNLVNILEQPEVHVLKKFLPIDIESDESGNGCALHVQVNFFECHGIAIGVCTSHKIADAATLSTFVNAWATIARDNTRDNISIPELYVGSSFFPPNDELNSLPPVMFDSQSCLTKRFVFDGSSIANMKAKAVRNGSQVHPTRVESVSALIWQCAMTAWRVKPSQRRVSSVLTHMVDLRKRLVPHLTEKSFGNLISYFAAEKDGEDQVQWVGLMDLIRKGSVEFSKNYVKKIQGNDRVTDVLENFNEFANLFSRLDNNDIDLYNFSSWCGFPFYEADFGWGKPIWVSVPNWPFKNYIILMDRKEGHGIEAWVTLKEEEMKVFEQNDELLAHATLNPSVSSKC